MVAGDVAGSVGETEHAVDDPHGAIGVVGHARVVGDDHRIHIEYLRQGQREG